MPKNIEIGKVFIIEKEGRKEKYKIIPHPFFDNGYALIGNHQLIHYSFKREDEKYIIHGCQTIEKAWEAAYDCT